jgi:hypothetical protein
VLVEGDGHVYQLSFPNYTTCYCAELERELVDVLGSGMVTVESAGEAAG